MGHYMDQIEFAHRVGKLAKQYNHLAKDLAPEDHYDATLHICLLQGLLTYCKELMDDRWRKSFFDEEIDSQTTFWGVSQSMITTNCFYTEHYDAGVTRRRLVTHLRNAVSHPQDVDPASATPSTGFVSVRPTGNQITTFAFVDSFNVENNEPCEFNSHSDAHEKLRTGFPREAFVEKYGYKYRIVVSTQGSYCSEPYTRVFRVDMPIKSLNVFVQELSGFLTEGYRPAKF